MKGPLKMNVLLNLHSEILAKVLIYLAHGRENKKKKLFCTIISKNFLTKSFWQSCKGILKTIF